MPRIEGVRGERKSNRPVGEQLSGGIGDPEERFAGVAPNPQRQHLAGDGCLELSAGGDVARITGADHLETAEVEA